MISLRPLVGRNVPCFRVSSGCLLVILMRRSTCSSLMSFMSSGISPRKYRRDKRFFSLMNFPFSWKKCDSLSYCSFVSGPMYSTSCMVRLLLVIFIYSPVYVC